MVLTHLLSALQNHCAVTQNHREGIGEQDVDSQGLAHLGPLGHLCGEKTGISWATGLMSTLSSATSLPHPSDDHQGLLT